jgi:beta-lactamase regulating signal transducer with metallopeptidase domain
MEAILLHEIGHVRRQDYLFNILQSVVETLFFFNPGLLWVSSLIRREREYCCDDFALLHTQDPISYIRALVIFEEFRQRSPRSALGFINSGNGVLNRLERLSAGKNRSLRRSELLLLVAIAGIGSLLMAAGPPPVTPIRHKMTVDMSATARDLDLKAKQQAEAAALERQGRLMQNH